ncbi:cAMP-dependent protein kinase [Candidatus Scalindua japonica]|uniref:cAMP-dependent protein kinase n=1 Tax=Candidatus Scalindua japonica TaxID=1284222 RepID=A0A286TXP3_9BACT|nr:cyclic nucleotide-binding domain-containing protein [Candidatus Scalindua japonica]GAX60652.1 cAMP-dependent protein kinase [Candidatus Scalindua japonica]
MDIKDLIFTNKEIRFKKNEIIFKEKEEGKEIYFIVSGMVKIVKRVLDKEVALAIIEPGEFFGDMSLITGNRRVASAKANTNCELNTMDKKTFELNLSNNKRFMKSIVESLAFRLEETDLTLKHYLQKTLVTLPGKSISIF